MRKARVLIVDDDVISRKILKTVLERGGLAEVVGLAPNGKVALQKIAQLNPDLITLDLEMPEMGGVETLSRIRSRWQRLPVLMVSGATEEGAQITLAALALGASDYITKPNCQPGETSELERLESELIPKVIALCKLQVAPPTHSPKLTTPAALRARRTTSGQAVSSSPARADGRRVFTARKNKRLGDDKPEILAIGVSTGGPNALAEIIPQLSADLPVPVVIVQHMPPMFTRLLAERLNNSSPLTVCEAAGGEYLERGHVYIAPGDYHMRLVRDMDAIKIHLDQAPPVNSCRPAVDPLFESVVDAYGERALGLILTGMGQDGLVGCEKLKQARSSVIIQDQATSVVWGMPGAVSRAGLADAELPLSAIARVLNERLERGPQQDSTIRSQAS